MKPTKEELKVVKHMLNASTLEERGVKFICVWCKVDSDKAVGRSCCAPDGDGHLFKRTEYVIQH